METAQDQELLEQANQKLLSKRAQTQMANPTRLMQSIDIVTCEHGIPKSIHCSKCNPREQQEVDKCQHGRELSHCWMCEEDKREIERIENDKNKMRELIKNPCPGLINFSVPKKYINSSFDTFYENDKLVKDCSNYESGGLVLYGNTGCGKTHLAVSIMRNLYVKNLIEIIKSEWKANTKYRASKQVFKPVPDLLLEIRSTFNDQSTSTEENIIDDYSTIPFLVLDDLGSEKTSEYSITTLYIILDRRDRELMPTVITTNLTPKEIEEKLGARIASRLAGMKNIKINMPDYRKKRI